MSLVYHVISIFLFINKSFIYSFIVGSAGSLSLRGLFFSCSERGLLSSCAGFSFQRLLLLQSMGSGCVRFSSFGSWALERRLNSCDAPAELLHGMWDLRRSGIEPMSPALACGFWAIREAHLCFFDDQVKLTDLLTKSHKLVAVTGLSSLQPIPFFIMTYHFKWSVGYNHSHSSLLFCKSSLFFLFKNLLIYLLILLMWNDSL